MERKREERKRVNHFFALVLQPCLTMVYLNTMVTFSLPNQYSIMVIALQFFFRIVFVYLETTIFQANVFLETELKRFLEWRLYSYKNVQYTHWWRETIAIDVVGARNIQSHLHKIHSYFYGQTKLLFVAQTEFLFCSTWYVFLTIEIRWEQFHQLKTKYRKFQMNHHEGFIVVSSSASAWK